MKEQWIEDIRQRLADYEQPAPTLDWDIIERAVAAQRATRRTRHIALWPRLAAAASVAALLAGTAWLCLSDQTPEVATLPKDPVRGVKTTRKTTAPTTQQTSDEATMTGRLLAAAGIVPAFPTDAVAEVVPLDASELLPETVSATVSATAPATTTDQPHTATEQPRTASESRTLPVPSRHATTAMPYQPRRTARTATLGALTAKAYVAGALGSANSTAAMGLLMSDAPLSTQDPDYATTASPELGQASVPDRQVRHHQPVRIGLSVRYRLNDRWSIEGGLSYSHHTSDITETAGDHTRQSAQQLDFIGIPVNVNYSIWSNRHVNIYASAGAEAERMVQGKRTVQTTIGGTATPEEQERVKMTRPVFSVNAAVGAEAKLGQTVSIYAEPGVGYHFDNGSPLPTIYTDKPLNATLNLGVRFSLK